MEGIPKLMVNIDEKLNEYLVYAAADPQTQQAIKSLIKSVLQEVRPEGESIDGFDTFKHGWNSCLAELDKNVERLGL